MLRCISFGDSRGASACTNDKSWGWGVLVGRGDPEGSVGRQRTTPLCIMFTFRAFISLLWRGPIRVCQTGTTPLPPMGQSQTNVSPGFKLRCLHKRDVSPVLPVTGPVREYRTNGRTTSWSMSRLNLVYAPASPRGFCPSASHRWAPESRRSLSHSSVSSGELLSVGVPDWERRKRNENRSSAVPEAIAAFSLISWFLCVLSELQHRLQTNLFQILISSQITEHGD